MARAAAAEAEAAATPGARRGPSGSRLRVRRATTMEDLGAAAALAAAAFAEAAAAAPLGLEVEGMAEFVEQQYRASTEGKLGAVLRRHAERKRDAAEATRRARADQAARRLAVLRETLAELAAASGGADPAKLKGEELKKVERVLREALAQDAALAALDVPASVARRQYRQRQWMCLVATDPAAGDAVVAAATVAVRTPEATLPPPFPTNATERAYVANMAVRPDYRRRGVASALLARCEQVAARWGFPDTWLHVDEGNEAAENLYTRLGYEEVGRDPWWKKPPRRLLRKAHL